MVVEKVSKKGDKVITIRFSHLYSKMPRDVSDTRLLAVFRVDRSQLSDVFLKWDTHFDDIGASGYYQLPDAKEYLVLLLLSGGHLWTTVRVLRPGKEEYYRSHIGESVKISFA